MSGTKIHGKISEAYRFGKIGLLLCQKNQKFCTKQTILIGLAFCIFKKLYNSKQSMHSLRENEVHIYTFHRVKVGLGHIGLLEQKD